MNQKCSNCGSNTAVVIKSKRYCSDCGNGIGPAVMEIAPQHKRATSKHSKSLHGRGNHVLDLRKHTSKPRRRPQHADLTGKGGSIMGTPVNIRTAANSLAHRVIQDKRLVRAKSIHRNPKISRFGPSLARIAATPVTAHGSIHDTVTSMAPHYSYKIDKKRSSPPKPRFVATSAAPPSTLSKEMVKNFTSDHQPKKRRLPKLLRAINKHSRLAGTGAIVASAVLLAAYIAYLNIPSVSLKVAVLRTGIDGQLPRYKPAGFSFSGPVGYKQNKITIRFTSDGDAGVLTVTEQKTEWDSETLREAYVQPNSQCEELYGQCINPNDRNGLRVYIYNGDQAAWINNGVLYTIEGSYELPTDEVLNIATSL